MFNDKYGLTKAVLEGRKTQTRRVIEKRLMDKIQSFQEDYFNASLDYLKGKELIEAYFFNYPKKLPYKVGEIVAVAQSYKDAGYKPDKIFYRSVPKIDGYKKETAYSQKGWNNKMFVTPGLMPHQIRITSIRIERLQDISDRDCLKEGVMKWDAGQTDIPFYSYCNAEKTDFDTPREAYAELIDKVSSKGMWKRNPYVFVYDFELVK